MWNIVFTICKLHPPFPFQSYSFPCCFSLHPIFFSIYSQTTKTKSHHLLSLSLSHSIPSLSLSRIPVPHLQCQSQQPWCYARALKLQNGVQGALLLLLQEIRLLQPRRIQLQHQLPPIPRLQLPAPIRQEEAQILLQGRQPLYFPPDASERWTQEERFQGQTNYNANSNPVKTH